jgi:hypothetical protein
LVKGKDGSSISNYFQISRHARIGAIIEDCLRHLVGMLHPPCQPHVGCQMFSLFASQTEHSSLVGVSDPLGFITLNKKKSAKNTSLLRLNQHNALSWLSSSQSAKKSAKVAGTVFSVKSARSTAILPEERLTSEVQALLNNAAGAIECGTGGHGRCANSRCGCRCHKSLARARPARNTSRAPRQSFSPCC